MTYSQEDHLARTQARFDGMLDTKYRAGVAEHGGNLWEKSARDLVIEAMQECVDQFAYLSTLLDKM